jgi:hypothetical protein
MGGCRQYGAWCLNNAATLEQQHLIPALVDNES